MLALSLMILLATSSVFTTHPQDQFICNKGDAVFECAANGSESLNISWTRNNEHIRNSHTIILNTIAKDGKKSFLRVKKATVDDSGFYQCIATHADNEVVLSNSAELLGKILFKT